MEIQRCEVCENESAKIKCKDCTKLFYFCENCYAISHQADSKKAHKIEMIKQLKTKDNKMGDPIQENLSCPKHANASCNMFCISCQKSVCKLCVGSKEHSSHKFDSISNIQKELEKRINSRIKKCNENLAHLESVKAKSSESQENIKKELKSSQIIIEEFFQKLESILKSKKEEFIQQIEKGNEPNLKNLLSISFVLRFIMIKLVNKIKFYESVKSNLNILSKINENWQVLLKESSELNSLDKTIADYENQINFFKNKNFAFSSIHFNDIESSINNWLLFSNSDLKMTNKSQDKLLLGKDYICEINKLNDKMNPERKMLTIFENTEWNNKLVMRTSKVSKSSSLLMFDSINKLAYFGLNEENGSQLCEYSCIDNLFADIEPKVISIDKEIENTSSFVHQGFLFHLNSNSFEIFKTNLKNGNIIESLNLNSYFKNCKEDVVIPNKTKVKLLNDHATLTHYLMYQSSKSKNGTLSELIGFPKLQIGKSWKLPFDIHTIQFVFINDYLLYVFQSNSAKENIEVFNLIDSTFISNSNISIPYEKWIESICFIPEESSLLISGNNRVIRKFAQYIPY